MARHNLPRLVARILLNRGLAAADDILAFLDPTLERLNPPFELPDLEVAAARLGRAVRQGEPVAVYGDYDADGITATAVLHQFLRELGLHCISYIPDRLTQGYGLKIEGLKELAEQARLMVTVDCGISDAQEVAWAKAQGLEVIITDHHEIPPELPDALAVVNPKRVGHAYPFGELAGVGVALLLALGVRADLRAEGWFRQRPEPNLRSLPGPGGPGHRRRRGAAGGGKPHPGAPGAQGPGGEPPPRDHRPEGSHPAGRQAHFLSERGLPAGAPAQCRRPDGPGPVRPGTAALRRPGPGPGSGPVSPQSQPAAPGPGRTVLKQARAMIRRHGLAARPVLVLAGEDWHPGVIGIVAARLADEYHRPVALVSLANGRGRGSARSIEGFHLFKGLQACRQALHKYGGHAAAAGFEMAADQLAALQELLEQAFVEQVGLEPPRPTLKVDAQVELHDLDRAFNQHLETLRPFGPGNPAPVIVCLGVQCLGSRVINQRHLKVQLAQGGGNVMEAIAFDMAAHHPLTGTLDVALGTRISHYQGRTSLDLRLLDWGKP